MTFTLNGAVLRRLLAQNNFVLPPAERVLLFGLRGALPVNDKDWELGADKLLDTASVDYLHPRCTLGVWKIDTGELMVCPGSTVPAQKFIAASAAQGGAGTNLLMEGLLTFTRGPHQSGNPNNTHEAFKEATNFPLRRTANDAVYDSDDALKVEWPGDDIHCGYCEGPSRIFDSSQGCQVVCGFPLRAATPGSKDLGAWPRFRDTAFASGQARFTYLLLDGADAAAAALSPKDSLPAILRFGSSGALVTSLQGQLKAKGLLAGTADGAFGGGTLLALEKLQRQSGVSADGVCGIHTAQALGIDGAWPKV